MGDSLRLTTSLVSIPNKISTVMKDDHSRETDRAILIGRY